MNCSSCLFALAVSAVLLGGSPARPAWAGDYLPQSDCDTLSTAGETDYTFRFWGHVSAPVICSIELRPIAYHDLPRAPITAWTMGGEWTAEWIEDEPGAIVIRGCMGPGQMFGPELHVRMPWRAGALEARFYREDGSLWRPFVTVFWCGSPPVPTQASSWGRLKTLYR